MSWPEQFGFQTGQWSFFTETPGYWIVLVLSKDMQRGEVFKLCLELDRFGRSGDWRCIYFCDSLHPVLAGKFEEVLRWLGLEEPAVRRVG